ncbi:hypothetical protein A2118_03350 [Candidatus Kaiserbacteria bacterium GWA2_50_9]|uniref:Transmembrane protein n=1 Tax=Candidatus Kaiserbacteria bacterium GWA2_50_9 TaxID=1798474 RepID=A0A1F6BVY0_9BACT|nr:MAG: hypothetical protein A2118_03350 [Candidatus Kaiserbacteria bacterium GWA2_50_9]
MDPELKRELDMIRALAKENHDMLRAIRRHQWWSFITTFVFWVVVLVAPFYLYQQYVQPIVSKFSAMSGTATPSDPSITGIQKLINSFKSGQ